MSGGNYYIYIGSDEDEDDNTNYEGKEKISLAALQEEVLNTFLEVKKKNRKMEEQQNEVQPDPRASALEKSDSKILSSVSNDTFHVTKKFKLNVEAKRKLEELTDLERMERRYGILTGKGADYINPKLS